MYLIDFLLARQTHPLLRAKWVFSAAIFAVPMYRRFRTLEGKQRSYVHRFVKSFPTISSMQIHFFIVNLAVADKIEKTAEVAIEVIDKVAEATEKVADEVAEEFPGNESIKKAASKIKKVMDVIEEDADKAEALIEKVSFITQSIASWQLLLHQIQSTLAV